MLDTKDVDAYLRRLARFRGWGGLGCPRDLRTVALHRESEISARAHAVPGSIHHDANLEGKSVDRLDAGRLVDDILAGVPLPAPGCQPTTSYCESGYTYGSPTGYYSSGQGGYGTTGGGYYGGGYPGGTAGYPGGYGYSQPGYDFGRPGYNPGGLGGPASGIGVRPGLGAGGFGPGADRPQVLRSPCGGARPGPTGSLGAVSAAVN